ncbi:MAG TPA: hypothetical protein ENH43_02855 [Phycisphaerales bacterium]|nr:hypothetical protein [Phycisphaerales bacterium]
MKRKLLAIVFCLLTLTAAYVIAEGRSMEVRPAGRGLLETRPAEIVTTTFRVTNNTGKKYEFISNIELPEGWVFITEDFPFDLGPNESRTKPISFFVPETTPAGTYEITYLVGARKYPAVRDFFTIDVVVLPHSKLDKQSEKHLPSVLAKNPEAGDKSAPGEARVILKKKEC